MQYNFSICLNPMDKCKLINNFQIILTSQYLFAKANVDYLFPYKAEKYK